MRTRKNSRRSNFSISIKKAPLTKTMSNLCTLPNASSSTFIFNVHAHSPLLNFYNFQSRKARCRNLRASLCSNPQNAIVVGCGAVSVDFLATVAAYPKPDDKIRSTSLKVQGGGNTGNASTCLARLGLNPRVISKVADDSQGRGILDELQADGVDTSFIVVSEEGTSPFTYIIVDNET